MKKISVFLATLIFTTFLAYSAPFVFGYNEDFTIKVTVPSTNSKILTKAQKMDTKMTALELSKKMGNGINLGNTLEATRNWNSTITRKPPYYEQLWGQPVTTPEMFVAYKEAGLNTVRIPVAWTNMMQYEKGDFTIAPEMLDRVETVVNYALDAGLYVIVNDHWDSQWWGLFGSENKKHRIAAITLYKSMWTQIANRFKNYDERLIFESANEELGSRLNDDTALSNKKKGILSEYECYDATNKINQCFVDLVRESGGNNKNRFLLIAGYNTDIDKTCASDFKMPVDKVKDRLLVSVHYYTPSTYCILSEDANWGKVKNSWGSKQDIQLMNNMFAKMKKFTDKGYGVIIGEYGVSRTKDGKMKEGMCEWLSNVLDNCDKYNYVPLLWDCNTFFKKTGKMGFETEEIAAVYKNRD